MENNLCEYGCGLEAKHQLKNGKRCCCIKHTLCIGFKKQTSKRLKEEFALGKRKKNTGHPHSEETKKRLSKCGGIKHGAGRGKHGWYKGYWCDSSWELAWVIYNLEHGIKFERNHQGFEYEYEGQKHKYYPDFILEDGTFIEIKGFLDAKSKAKILQFEKPILVFSHKEIKPLLLYVSDKYGNEFISLYDDYKKETETIMVCKSCGKEFKGKKNTCKDCILLQRRISWQSKEILEKEIAEMTWEEIARKYNLSSGNSIKKRAKVYGIKFNTRRLKEKI